MEWYSDHRVFSIMWAGCGEGEKGTRGNLGSEPQRQSKFCGEGEEFILGCVERNTQVKISCKMWKCGLGKVWIYRC